MFQFEGQIARTATKVSGARTEALQDVAQSFGRSFPPRYVSAQRKEMVQEIITGRDRCKHLTYGAGSGFSGLCRTPMAGGRMEVGRVIHVNRPAALPETQFRRGLWGPGLKS